jgi:hypothetical protein
MIMPITDPGDIKKIKIYVEECGMPQWHNDYTKIVHRVVANCFEVGDALAIVQFDLKLLGYRTVSPSEFLASFSPQSPVTRTNRSNSASMEMEVEPKSSSTTVKNATSGKKAALWNLPEVSFSSYTSVDRDEYLRQLADLERTQKRQPVHELRRRVKCAQDKPPQPHYCSKDIDGRSNQECVLAAFATVCGMSKSDLDGFRLQYANQVTSLDKVMSMIALKLGLSPLDQDGLMAALQKGKRVFLRAPALEGGGYHAYCAFACDTSSKYVAAWDPDNDHQDVKAIPIEMVDAEMIYG